MLKDDAFVDDAVHFATKFIDAIHSKAMQKDPCNTSSMAI